MTIPMKGNWNYPTRVWSGPGRIAELPAACADLGIRKPLRGHGQGLRESQMIRKAVASLPGAGAVCRRARQSGGSQRGSGPQGVSRRRLTMASWPSAAARASTPARSSPSCRGRRARCGISRTSATGGRARIRRASRRWSPCPRLPAPAAKWAAPASSSTRRRTRRRSSSTRR